MKILLAIDGSQFSQAALDFCRNFNPDPKSTSFRIISTVEYPAPMPAEPFAISSEYYREVEQEERRQAGLIVDRACKCLHGLFPNIQLDLSTEIISGSPQRAIVETAREWGADVIVMGSHGYGFWSRALLGSVSNTVSHDSPCSVLIVRNKK